MLLLVKRLLSRQNTRRSLATGLTRCVARSRSLCGSPFDRAVLFAVFLHLVRNGGRAAAWVRAVAGDAGVAPAGAGGGGGSIRSGIGGGGSGSGGGSSY